VLAREKSRLSRFLGQKISLFGAVESTSSAFKGAGDHPVKLPLGKREKTNRPEEKTSARQRWGKKKCAAPQLAKGGFAKPEKARAEGGLTARRLGGNEGIRSAVQEGGGWVEQRGYASFEALTGYFEGKPARPNENKSTPNARGESSLLGADAARVTIEGTVGSEGKRS